MNCGITQGIMEEALQKAADIRITGADYDTGKISYAKLNQNLIIGNIISSNKNGDTMAQKEIKEKIRDICIISRTPYLIAPHNKSIKMKLLNLLSCNWRTDCIKMLMVIQKNLLKMS